MKPDKYRKRFRPGRLEDRVRRQIAVEAARRVSAALGPDDPETRLAETTEAQLYNAKRQAAAVLGHTVRPGDLPSDTEVREQVLTLLRSRGEPDPDAETPAPEPTPSPGEMPHISEHVDRFEIYRMRLLPLESVKQDPQAHPEGDALYHSLQVFERARERRPYDEEFLLAALLHDVGKAIDPRDHIPAALEALRGTLTERAAWLIEHHHDLSPRPGRAPSPKERRLLEDSPYYDDLALLREADQEGTAVGVPVGTLDEAIAYLRGLEHEAYLDEGGEPA